MISFILIGRNEGEKLVKCVQSVKDTVHANSISEYEIIYVDSASTDKSIDFVKKFEEVKIFKITGDYNAAIARNIGFKESRGEILFFIDGDMEIVPEFLPNVLDNNFQLKYEFVSGQFINYYYDYKGNFLSKNIYHTDSGRDVLDTTTGGLFLIKRKNWELVNGMKTKYRRSQDLDLGLRLAAKGIFRTRKKEIMGKHHTIEYLHKKRMWKMLFDGSEFYGKSLLYRDHLLNRHIYPVMFRRDYSLVLFLLLIAINAFALSSFYYSYLLYFGLIALKAIKKKKNNYADIPSTLAYYWARDMVVIAGFLFFHPKPKNKLEYTAIQ